MQNQINTKAVKLDTYPKAEINVALGILQAGINTKVLSNAVDIHGKFTIHALSHAILKIQRVVGTTFYGSFELSFNPVDKTSILTVDNVDVLQAINNNGVAANVYSKSELGVALNLKSTTLTTHSKTDVHVALSSLQAGTDNRVVLNADDINGKF